MKKATNQKNKYKKAYTMIELLISIAIFGVVVSINVAMLSNALSGQKRAMATQNISNSTRYAMELMVKELRVLDIKNTIDSSVCTNSSCISGDGVFTSIAFISGTENRMGNIIKISYDPVNKLILFDDDALDASPAEAITSLDNINVTSFNFTVANFTTQAKITLTLKAEAQDVGSAVSLDDVFLQTTVSPRAINL